MDKTQEKKEVRANGSFINFFMNRHQVNHEEALEILAAFTSTESSKNNKPKTNEEKTSADSRPLEYKKYSGGIYLEMKLYRSHAFLSLGRNAVKDAARWLGLTVGAMRERRSEPRRLRSEK